MTAEQRRDVYWLVRELLVDWAQWRWGRHAQHWTFPLWTLPGYQPCFQSAPTLHIVTAQYTNSSNTPNQRLKYNFKVRRPPLLSRRVPVFAVATLKQLTLKHSTLVWRTEQANKHDISTDCFSVQAIEILVVWLPERYKAGFVGLSTCISPTTSPLCSVQLECRIAGPGNDVPGRFRHFNSCSPDALSTSTNYSVNSCLALPIKVAVWLSW